ncbi:MAG: HEPN domain-containing protein [Rubrobacter sp.]|nr:HEPN domain-containing protein [Rubrobacter sp.]
MNEMEALLEKAERSFAAARLLINAGNGDFAVSRAYYGYFYVAEALLRSKGL